MTEPTTDPRSPGPVPDVVIGRELWLLRRELHAAAVGWSGLEKHPDPAIASVAALTRALLFRAVNVGNAAGRPPDVPRWRRVWLALVG